MEDTNINIIFSNQQSGGSESDPEVPGTTPNPEAPEQTMQGGKNSSKAMTMTKALGVAVAKQSINLVTSRVGAVTRSNVKQQQVDTAMKMAGYGIGIGTAIATGNWGAVAMIGVSAGMNLVNDTVNYNHNKGIEETALSINRKRAGIDRSR